MAPSCESGPHEFLFRVGESAEQRVSATDAQQAYEAFWAFRDGHAGEGASIDDPATGERLLLLNDEDAIVRVAAGGARTEYLKVDWPSQYSPSTLMFFEDGFAGLDYFGQWLPNRSDLAAAPAERGATRAAMFTGDDAAALVEVGRIWSDSGFVDETDEYVVFFDSKELDDEESARAELLILLEQLGLPPVAAPAEAAEGEVWVRATSELRSELDNWG